MTEQAPFSITPGAAESSVIVHVPHSSTRMPPDVARGLELDAAEVDNELAHMTDAHTDVIATGAAQRLAAPPWIFVNQLSRLVIDPERFPDEREEMLEVGMGAVYTRTSHREVLRQEDTARDELLIDRYFRPYADALADLVDERLAATGRAVIIDLHSYPSAALPYERHPAARRPAICIGTDARHTPKSLIGSATAAFAGLGDVHLNEPFAGTYVPLRHHGKDDRVHSLMIEIRRDVYMDEPGGRPTPGLDDVTSALADYLGDLELHV